LDEDVEVGSTAFKEGLEFHDTGVGGGKVEVKGDTLRWLKENQRAPEKCACLV